MKNEPPAITWKNGLIAILPLSPDVDFTSCLGKQRAFGGNAAKKISLLWPI